jgi:hypothetical protein
MKTLNADGTPRKKYTTKKMIMKKNRKNGQKKAWDTRRALYPETNGYKPEQVEDAPKGDKFRGYNEEVVMKEQPIPKKEEEVPSESVPSKPDDEDVLTDELVQKLSNLETFLNSIPGVEFDREKFVREATTTAVETVLQGVAVVCHGEEELTKKLKGMMEFVEGS